MKNIVPTFQEHLLNEEKYIGGLHQAKVGDMISIGIEGTRVKHYHKIVKIGKNNRLIDSEGNIFGRNGIIFKRKGYKFKSWDSKKRIVSAKIVTQKEFDVQYKKIKVDFLRKFDYDKLDIEDVEKIIDTIPNIRQANVLNKSRLT